MSEKMKVGRKPLPNIYKDVIYNNKQYVVCNIVSPKITTKFVIDKDDYENVSQLNWCVTSVGYIASTQYVDGIKKLLLLHRFIMNVPYFPGKGAKETVDHINRNPLDNRKENLRVVSQSEQNINQGKRPRKVVLPEGCGIDPDQIPRHIWYIKPNGAHGDRFAIELKTENIIWKTTSSKQVSLQDKLKQAIDKLDEIYIQYPTLHPHTNETSQQSEELIQSFTKVLSLLPE